MTDNIVGDECSISSSGSSLEQNIDVNELVDSKPLSFETNSKLWYFVEIFLCLRSR